MVEFYINAGKPCCLFITPDCYRITPNFRMVQYKGHNNYQNYDKDNSDRYHRPFRGNKLEYLSECARLGYG